MTSIVTLVRSQSAVVKLAECTTWCLKNYPNPALTCVTPALRGQGPCYICGPFKTASTEALCSGKCTDTSSDAKNCGKCGNACPQGATCSSGACVCTNSGRAPCNGVCPNLQSDTQNCGACGNVCAPGENCLAGVCGVCEVPCDYYVCSDPTNCPCPFIGCKQECPGWIGQPGCGQCCVPIQDSRCACCPDCSDIFACQACKVSITFFLRGLTT